MKCLFCKKDMAGFHVCDNAVQNMSLRPDGMERFGYVTFGEVPPNKARSRLIEGVGNLPAEKSYSVGSAPAKSG